jgi:hypothetical protein
VNESLDQRTNTRQSENDKRSQYVTMFEKGKRDRYEQTPKELTDESAWD